MSFSIKSKINMASPVTKSVIFHGVICIVAVVGFPHIQRDIPRTDQSITVEFVDVDEFTQTTKSPSSKEKDGPEKEPAKKDDKPKPAPQVTADAPPSPVKPVAPKAIKPVPLPDAPPKKPEAKKEPKTKPKPMLTRESPEDIQDKEFESVLKNLMPVEPEDAERALDRIDGALKKSPNAPLGQKMTSSEMDRLTRQLARCWNLMAGARYAEDLVVDVRLYIGPDRIVRKADVLDKLRYSTDNFFRAAADSAIRAVYNPQCAPLDVPADKYDLWKVMTVRFDPREMLL